MEKDSGSGNPLLNYVPKNEEPSKTKREEKRREKAIRVTREQYKRRLHKKPF
jgi:hypothetical protein